MSMKVNILKRVKDIESRIRTSCLPDLVMVFYSDYHQVWIVKENYATSKGEFKTIEKRYTDPNDYDLPEGFNGVCIVDDLFIPEGEESPFAQLSQGHDEDDCRLIHRQYI